jgi:exonuclease SbcC
MKLHSLEIQAFGPFSKKEVIDFSALGENALFLIDGPTGAGKSSILHAICYALYGETTDSDRKELGLRCDHSDADLLTELTLEFSIRDDRYRITRVPTQMRPSKRKGGSGETEQKSEAHLRRVLADGIKETLVPKKTRDADTKIEEIVGLSSEQFLQVMVLPQGKFRELLLAKSDDRQIILSTLFQTEIYKRIEQLLKEKAGAIEKQKTAFDDRKKEAYLDVHVADSDALEKSIEDAVGLLESKREDKESAADKKQQATTDLKAAEALDKSFANRNSKQKDLETYLQKTDEINSNKIKIKRAEKALSIAPKQQVLEEILADIKAKLDNIATAKTEKENAVLRVNTAKMASEKSVEAYKQRDPLKVEEKKIEGYKIKLDSYQPLKDASLTAEKVYKDAVSKKNALEEKATAIEKILTDLSGDIQSLNNAVENKVEVVEKKNTAYRCYEKRAELETARVDLGKLVTVSQELKGKFGLAKEVFKKSEKDANHVEMQWFTNQAAVLAEKLEEDLPCAVCGSSTHPNPASFSEDSTGINQEIVDQARALQAQEFKKMDTVKSELQGSEHSVTNKETDIEELEIELSEVAIKSVADVKQSYTKLDEELKNIEIKENDLVKAKDEKLKNEGKKQPILDEIKQIEATMPELITSKATAKSELESASNTLPEQYRNIDAIESVLTQTRKKITALEKSLEASNQEQIDSLSHDSSVQAQLKELSTSLDKLNGRARSQSLLWDKALADSEFVNEKDFLAAQLSEGDLEAYRLEVTTYDDSVRKLQTELDLLNGQLKDKQPPDLDKLQQTLKELSDAFTAVEELWTNANLHHNKLIETQVKVEKIEKDQAEITKQYEIVGTLSKAASGRGNVRVSLERFVLGNILDQVLSIASQRLHMMSKGQYRLIRQNEEDQKRNTTAGLDLAIDDAYTGKTRPVATLSGGESFMASLALALGLSDVVQERSGGIQLDTLFIDEGFGSLDQESLQLAINTLIELQSTGRTIGIISHVSELKEQMSQRVEVTGSRSGSTIKMIA